MLGLVALGVLVLVGLGAWQLQRNNYKHDLEAEFDARIALPPLDGEEAAGLSGDEVDFRRVHLVGTWDHAATVTIANRIRFGLRGEEIVTPLRLDDGRAVLVNRGWVPLEEKERVLAELATSPTGEVEGLAREDGGSAREIAPGVWSRYAVASIATALPYDVAPWRFTEGELRREPLDRPPAELPITGYEGFENTVPHVQYALTWFGLAGALVVTAGFRVTQLRREQHSSADDPPSEGGE